MIYSIFVDKIHWVFLCTHRIYDNSIEDTAIPCTLFVTPSDLSLQPSLSVLIHGSIFLLIFEELY